MLQPQRLSGNHEEVFIERYDRLFGWALQLSGKSRDQAEDLVQDAFVQFTFSRPDLHAIQNLDGYLYGMLRNLRLLQLRRATRTPLRPLAIVEYDSAELGIRAMGLHAQLQVQDELRMVCRYVCLRKETSKVASALILRFFHGYYSDEIAQLMQSSRRAVNEELRVARREAKLFLRSPGSLSFFKTPEAAEVNETGAARKMEDFLSELRRTIFQARHGDCFSVSDLLELYRPGISTPISCAALSHLVSCAQCLDEANRILGLPLLKERYPTDTLGTDSRPKGAGGGTPTGTRDAIKRCRKRAKDVFEHRPQELCIAVNRDIQVWQKITSAISEQSISLDETETVDLVEITSEQGIPLLFLAVEGETVGPVRQAAEVELSEGRSLAVTLDHSNLWPVLRVVYHDPTFVSESEAVSLEAEVDGSIAEVQRPTSKAEVQSPASKGQSSEAIDGRRSNNKTSAGWARLRNLWNFRPWTLDFGLLLRPASVTAIIAVLLISALLFVWLRKTSTPPSAADLLNRSALAEEALAAKTDRVLHRTLSLEEHKSTGELITQRRIEVWQSAERGVTARRLYDEHGKLIVGDWRRADGVQMIYHHGAQPKLQLAPTKRGPVALSFDSVWQLETSAKEFARLIKDSPNAHVEERSDSYLISAESVKSADAAAVIVRATLTLNRTDLHPTQQTLLVRQGEETREYRFIETTFEQKPLSTVAPAVFEPDAELLSSTKPETRNSKPETSSPLPFTTLPVAASPELEVEVLRLLNQAGADMGEQINVTRSPEGQLQVQGIVETDARKREILRVLEPVRNNPAVKIQISSVVEALQRQGKPGESSGQIVVERSDSGSSTTPVDAELQRYFVQKGESEEQAAASARRFANRVLSQSSQALQHAWAVKRLTERSSPEELRKLSPEARANWLAMIREHCRALQQINASMRRELQPVFFPSSPSDNTEQAIEINDDADLTRAAERLLGICTSNDKLVSAAFTVSSGSSSAATIKAPQFARSLRSAESLAAKIGAVARP